MRVEYEDSYLEISEMRPDRRGHVLTITTGRINDAFRWTWKLDLQDAQTILEVCRRAVELAEKHDAEK